MGTTGSEGMGEVLKNVDGGLLERKDGFWGDRGHRHGPCSWVL